MASSNYPFLVSIRSAEERRHARRPLGQMLTLKVLAALVVVAVPAIVFGYMGVIAAAGQCAMRRCTPVEEFTSQLGALGAGGVVVLGGIALLIVYYSLLWRLGRVVLASWRSARLSAAMSSPSVAAVAWRRILTHGDDKRGEA